MARLVKIFMYFLFPKLQKKFSGFLGIFSKYLHEKIKLSPNQISVLGFVFSLISAFFVYQKFLVLAFILLFISLFFDAMDGIVARQYHLETSLGAKIEIIFDRTAELVLFFALVLAGFVDFYLAITAWLIIILMTIATFYTHIDLGFKRIIIFFGPFIGFHNVFYIIIGAQLLSLVIGLSKLRFFYANNK